MHQENELIENFTGLLIFEVAGRDYCLNDAIISSIIKSPFSINHYDKQNGRNSYLEVNNNIIPLISLTNLFDYPKIKESTTKDSRVIIIEFRDERYGLLVDRIKEMIALDSRYITDCIKFSPGHELPEDCKGRKFLEGSLEIEDRCVLLLNIDPIVSSYKLLLN